jgi:uncharacterized membrane protein
MCSYPIDINGLYPGTTYHYRKNSYLPTHLHIILAEPNDIEGTICIVSVNITTQTNTPLGLDTTVVLNVGDHPFIKRPSVVAYSLAVFSPVKDLIRYINDEKSLDDDLDDEILQRIQKGLLASDFTPIEILEYCKDKFDDS